jgi:hypothetical protein
MDDCYDGNDKIILLHVLDLAKLDEKILLWLNEFYLLRLSHFDGKVARKIHVLLNNLLDVDFLSKDSHSWSLLGVI